MEAFEPEMMEMVYAQYRMERELGIDHPETVKFREMVMCEMKKTKAQRIAERTTKQEYESKRVLMNQLVRMAHESATIRGEDHGYTKMLRERIEETQRWINSH
jgi:hypothetical protein